MSQQDTDRFEALISAALAEDADRAPHLSDSWPGPHSATVRPTPGRTHRRLPIVVGAAAALIMIIAVAVIVRTRAGDTAPASSPISSSAWRPVGVEFPLVDRGPTTEITGGPTVSALTRQIGVTGHPDQILTQSLEYRGNATAVETACTWEQGSGGCRVVDSGPSWSPGMTSSVDNHVAATNLLTVKGLPSSVAFVTFDDGGGVTWQRPVDGFAAFPAVNGPAVDMIAYDSTGHKIGRYGFIESAVANQSVAQAPMADVSRAQFDELDRATKDLMSSCLTAAGGPIGSGNVATFATSVEQVAVWHACVASVQTNVAAKVAALGVRMYDPATDRPENPQTPFQTGASNGTVTESS